MENQSSPESGRSLGRSREDRKSLSESFVDGTSKFFSSMVAKKNGLISDLSNKIETTFANKSDHASSSAGSEGSVSPPMSPQAVPNTPPPRPPPPPRRQPSIEAIQQARSSMKRMTSVPAYPASGRDRQSHPQGRGQSSERVGKNRRQSDTDEKISVNGMNISFDEPIYNKPEEAPAPKPLPRKTFGPRDSDSSPNRGSNNQGSRENTSTVVAISKSNHTEANAASKSLQTTPKVNVSPASHSSVKDSSVCISQKNNSNSSSSEQGAIVAEGYGEVISPETSSSPRPHSGKAPKFTTTTRRSSTVDEMLFDDYVAPEEDPVPTKSPEEIPDNLISFEPDTEVSACSPSSSSSDIEAGVTDRYTENRRPKAGASVDSSDAEFGGAVIPRSGSLGSEKSWSSNYSVDSQPDDLTLECMEFMKAFVDKIFHGGDDISQTDKATFGRLCQQFPGRLWFSRYVNGQRVNSKKVTEAVFFRLMQYFAVCLFECNEADDFSPAAKTLMTMCFTFYYEGPSQQGGEEKVFLYTYLRDQPIWQSLRFWNAAFFDAVQNERSRRPMPTNTDGKETMTDDRQFQANITFGQLGTFACNMRSFGLSKELCLEFLRKQSTIANLNKDQVKLLRDNLERVNEKT